jgi:hypothetical protein
LQLQLVAALFEWSFFRFVRTGRDLLIQLPDGANARSNRFIIGLQTKSRIVPRNAKKIGAHLQNAKKDLLFIIKIQQTRVVLLLASRIIKDVRCRVWRMPSEVRSESDSAPRSTESGTSPTAS